MGQESKARPQLWSVSLRAKSPKSGCPTLRSQAAPPRVLLRVQRWASISWPQRCGFMNPRVFQGPTWDL